MPKPNYTDPVSPADATARKAFRNLRERLGAAELANRLGVSQRTVERIGAARDVPPGIAVDLAAMIAAELADDGTANRYLAAFSAWAEECRQRTEGRQHG